MSIKYFKSGRGVDFKYAKGQVDIYPSTFHDHYELYLFLGGKAEFINEHTRLPLSPYQLIIIRPGKYHQIRINGDVEEYERCVLNVSTDLLPSALLCDAFDGKELIDLTPNGRAAQDFLYIKDIASHFDDDDLCHILPAVATDIIFAVKNLESDVTATALSSNSLSHSVMKYINDHFNREISLLSVAEQFHVSISSLCHIFKRDFGISVKQYILQKRLSAAHLYIKQGAGAEQASASAGFCNYSAFYRAYKKHFGAPPSQNQG